VVVGVVLAGAGLWALGHWEHRFVEEKAQQAVAEAAARKLALAEYRIGRVIATLDTLAGQGIESCGPEQLGSLRKAVFSNVMIKEISVIGADGRAACTTSGLAVGARKMLSSQAAAPPAAHVWIDVFSIGDAQQEIVQIRRTGGDTAAGLGALLLGRTLIAQGLLDAGALNGYARMTTRDGASIGVSGRPPEVESEDDVPLTAHASSARYGLNLNMLLSRSAFRADAARIRTFGLLLAGGIIILLLAFFVLVPKRQRDNPIVELERALKSGEFVPYYQPVVDLVSGKLRGAEVLIRWRKPDGSVPSPAVFIPLAESSGVILDMTRYLMRRVCREIGPAFAERQHLKVSFNLAARHFEDETIVRDVRDIFGRNSVRLSQLVLALTERQPIENLIETRRLIATLQGMGVRMAIDDVGTGHSGLSYILKLGVDIIKIDKMFIDAIGIERSSTTIIETLIDLAHNMRMEVIAEGVENFEQVVCLRERGVRAAQGFVFAPPLPGSSFLQLIEAIDPLETQAWAAEHKHLAVA
jgi:sensor c-di-GMP phosphodiesterase-like protein